MPPRFVCPVEVTNGKIPTTSNPTTTSTRRVMRTDGTVISSLGIGRCSSLACQALATSSPPRSALRCWRSSPAAMRTRRPKSTSALSLSSENWVAWVTMEMATAANTVAGRLRIRPTTAAASAGSSTPGANPAAAPGWVRKPVRVTLAPASRPASAPDQGGEAADADAEEGGPLGVLGHGPHRHAGAGEAEEGGQAQEEQDRHLDGEDLGEPEAGAVAADVEVEAAEGQQARIGLVPSVSVIDSVAGRGKNGSLADDARPTSATGTPPPRS